MTRRSRRAAYERESRLGFRVDSIAARSGLRVLRELGEGGASLVSLVVPHDADPFRPIEASRVALKIPRSETKDDRVVREDRVLAAVRSPHVVALLRTEESGADALFLEYLSGGTLAELLARREFLRVGEAVTIVVSLARALSALHSAGFWHGALSASKIMFAGDGRPVVVGLSHAIPVAPSADRSAPAAPAPDDDGFREIVDLVARAVGAAAIEPAVGELVAVAHPGLAASMGSADWLQLEARVFAVARAEPVLLVAPTAPMVHRSDGIAAMRSNDRRGRIGGSTAGTRGRRDVGRLAPILKFARERRRFLREKRRLLIYSCGCLVVAAAVTVGMTAVPKSGAVQPAPSASTRASVPAPHDRTARTSASPQADASATTSPDPTTAREGAAEDDPVDAAVRLLRARYECFAGGSLGAGCLEPLLQPGSGMHTSDVALLRAGPSDAAASSRDFRDFEVSLIERMGDAVLLALTPRPPAAGVGGAPPQTKPASLLMVRGEAGWRLRELFEN